MNTDHSMSIRRRRPDLSLPATALPPPAGRNPGLEELLERALLHGDEASFAEAVRRMRPMMMRMALGYVRSSEDVEDLIQDTWMAALRGAARFERRSLLSTWILRILSYRARTYGKRAARSVPFSRASLIPGEIDRAEPLFGRPAAAADEATDARETRGVLVRALLELSPRQRKVFRLRELKGLSSAEVCLRLGLTPGNERLLLHRARTHVRRRLSAYLGRLRRTPAPEADGGSSDWLFAA
jgi:RNA polymerase sigma-70 factor (ECF subfamily)